MPLYEEFVSSGQWLFRWRSYLPLALYPPVAFVMWTRARAGLVPAPDHAWDLFCVAISLLGVVVRAVAIGCAPAGTSGRNTDKGLEASTVNTTGMYSVVRHPLYVGNFLMWLGVALLPRSAWLAIVISFAFWLYYERIMFTEEEFLRRQFGERYEQWARATPAFVPKLRGWRSPSLSFSGRNVLRREYSGLFGLVASFTLLDAVRETAARGAVAIDRMWVGIFGATLLFYVATRALKKGTHVLHVEGR